MNRSCVVWGAVLALVLGGSASVCANPDLRAGTPSLTVQCDGGPDNDGEPDPGETVILTLPIRNEGTSWATGVSAWLSVTSPVGEAVVIDEFSSYPDIGPGATLANDTPFRVWLDPAMACGPVDLELEVAANPSGARLDYAFDVGLASCDPAACVFTCEASEISRIKRLKATSLNAVDLDLSWTLDPKALDGYNVWHVVNDKSLLPACSTCPGSQPLPGCQPTGDLRNVSCTQAGALPGSAREVFFYNVFGVCQGGEARPALGSNTAFKLNYPLEASGANTLSIPYFYYPSGDVNDPNSTAGDLCSALRMGGCSVNSVSKLERDPQARLFWVTHPCGNPFINNFTIAPGDGYFVNSSASCTVALVGSHDAAYSTKTPPASGGKTLSMENGTNYFSVPYHIKEGIVEELCQFFMTTYGQMPGIISWIDPVTAAPNNHPCGNPIIENFDLRRGEAYFFFSSTQFDFQWNTY